MDLFKEKLMYNKFAYVYDHLMKDAPYSEWVSITEAIIEKYHISPKQIVDLGCGTGNIALPLRQSGYQMVGIDLSADMLSIAHDKMAAKNLSFPLIQQDMREFNLPNKAELIISYCDSLNYLDGIEDVKQTFIQVNKHLSSGGYFIFDMHSPYKILQIYNQNTFAWNDEDISVIWLPEVDENELIVEHDLTFFVKDSEACYEKFNEVHRQQTYSIKSVRKLLIDIGFEIIDIFGDFQLQPVNETTERIFYVARKQ